MQIEVGGNDETALGYIFAKEFWGKGFATEAALGCINYAFSALGSARVVALIRPENTSSERVARTLRMQPERDVWFAGFRHSVYVATKEIVQAVDEDSG